MKIIIKRCIFVMFFLLGSQSANAGLFGWDATIIAVDPDTGINYQEHASGATQFICETNRTNIINNYIVTLGYTIISQPLCSRRVFNIPNIEQVQLIRWWPRIPWPGPGSSMFILPIPR